MLPEIKAWRAFSKQVEERLEEQNDRGYTGWDDENDISTALLKQQLTDDVSLLEREGLDKTTCVDIAARSMMLHRRAKG